MPRERNAIIAALLLLAAAAWAILLSQPRPMEALPGVAGVGVVYLATWIVMMVAMMFPTAAPMILTFAKVESGRSGRRGTLVATSIFVGSYLLLWVVFGVLANIAVDAAGSVAQTIPAFEGNAARVGGLAILLAGLYQLTPLKRSCLARCRTPMDFVLGSWRDGLVGTFRMGLEHGVYCLGCCWLLFVILFPLGMMNLGAMALITLLIFAEKSLPLGRRIGVVAAAALIVYGALVIFVPDLLPTMRAVDVM